MDSVNQALSMSSAMSQMQTAQEIQTALLKKVLNNQSDMITTLVQSAVQQVAKDGLLGGTVDTTA